ncbi:MAG: translocation/assembly module TamB domain-containing protein [Steroidobacteraceae bacterium]
MRRLLHASWISLTVLLLIPAAALYYLAWTENGLAWAAQQMNRQIGKTRIEIEGVHGTLAGGFSIGHLVVDHPRTRVEISAAQGDLSLLPLLWQTIRVPKVHAAHLIVQVRHYEDDSKPRARFLPALMSIYADRASVDVFTLIAPNGWSGEFDRITASGVVHSRDIRVFSSDFAFGVAQVQARGTVTSAHPTGLTGSGRATIPASGTQPQWLTEFVFDGDLDKLDLSGDFRAPFAVHYAGSMLTMTTNWHWQADAAVNSLDLTAFGAGNVLGIITGKLKLDGDVKEFRAKGALTPPGLKSGPLQVEFAGDYRQRTINAHRFRIEHAPSGSVLTGAGPITFASGGPTLGLVGLVQNLRWPLNDSAAPVQNAQGSYRLEGNWPYRLHLDGQFNAPTVPPISVVMDGALEHERLAIEHAQLQWLDGNGRLSGEARWKPAESWALKGNLANLDPAKLRSAVSGRLTFAIDASGKGFGADGSRDLKISNIAGTVRGQAASGHAEIASMGTDWLFRDVRVQLGRTRIEADGRMGASDADMSFALEAEDLALLNAGAEGQLSARGTFRGDLKHPVLKVQATGNNLKWQQHTLGSLRGNVDFDAQQSGRADLQLRLENLSVANRVIDRIELSTQGTVAAHRDTLRVITPQLQVQASGNGQFNEGEWHVALDTLQATDGDQIQLALESPANVMWSPEHFSVAPLCLHNADARVCGNAEGDRQRSTVQLNAQKLPLQALTAGLTKGTEYRGTLTVDASGSMVANGPWNGTLRATLADAAIGHQLASGKIETFNLGSGEVSLALDPKLWRASAALDAGDAGNLKASLQTTSNGGDWRGWPLSGNFELHSDALPYIESYVTDIDRAAGKLDSTMQVAGTLEAPRLSGKLSLTDGEFDLYELNLALRAVNFTAQLSDNKLGIEGSARAGNDGNAAVKGDIEWRDGWPWGKLHLSGSDLRIANIPEARVQASPNVDLTLKGRRIEVTGEVLLPYARLEEPEQLASAKLTSSDEMIVGQEQTPADKRFIVTTSIALKLGDRVTLNTQGLSGRLSGNLSVSSDESGISRGTGELNVEEGKYSAYGRKLDIERGRLLFGNGLLTDPGIDLRATKKFPDVTAGVNVRGTLRAPRMTFFSEPALTQSQIVSLLLAGGSLESVQNSSTDSTTTGSNSARANALLQGSAIFAQQFGNKVGIEDVSVESDLDNDTSLVLGRYLSPRLYISYGISLTEAINTIKMRYTLGDHWTIKTEAGTARSADLVYTIEK